MLRSRRGSIKLALMLVATSGLHAARENSAGGAGSPASREAITLRSPDGHIEIRFGLKADGDAGNRPFYAVRYKEKDVLLDSPLGLHIQDAPRLFAGFEVAHVTRTSGDARYTPVYGERRTIRDHYNQLDVDLIETSPTGRRLRLTFRVYNEGAALRYTIPGQAGLSELAIQSEETCFRFPEGCTAYEEHGTEGEYRRAAIGDIKRGCERPLTVEYPGGLFASLTEAHLDDYSRMLLSPAKGRPGTLVSDLSGPVEAPLPFSTPWRVLVIGERPGDLIEHNDIVRNLNPPCALKDTAWIKPGKVIREVTLSTQGGKECVDFAVKHNLQYVEYDAGWYGHEYDDRSDATTVTPDPKRTRNPDLALQEVIDYANGRGIGIFLYVNRRALESQLDEILPLYEKWGIKGVKYGFVEVGPQKATNFLHRAIRKAAQHRLLVDVHDSYRPTGFSRTYPNLLTQEGVRGNEHMPTAEHNCTLPFTRLIAGAADVTVCYYTDRITTTHAHQLATAVVFYSPLQFLFWYDRPSAYRGEPEIEFFEHLPTVWDDTQVIHGQIGDFVTIARKKGQEWFVGSLTDENARVLDIPLSFLDPGRKYIARIYQDAGEGERSRTNVGIEGMFVDTETVVTARMAASGGHAMRIEAMSAEDEAKFRKYD